MPKIVAVHSYRGGTGKSNTTANLAALLAAAGWRVAVVDMDIQSPGIHVLFGLDEADIEYTLNDYLWDRCEIRQAVMDVTPRLETSVSGKVFLVPASIKAIDIVRVLREGYDVERLKEGFRKMISGLQLDFLLIDTHPGLNEDTLLSIVLCNVLILMLRPDQQDYQGTRVTVAVARRLDVPQMWLLVNRVPAQFDIEAIKTLVQDTYDCDVIAALPNSDKLMELASEGIFTLRYPDHPLTNQLKAVAAQL